MTGAHCFAYAAAFDEYSDASEVEGSTQDLDQLTSHGASRSSERTPPGQT